MLRFFIITFFFFFSVMGTFAGLDVPTSDPPLDNILAPLTVSDISQVKSGDLELNALEVSQFINLGGISKNEWPSSVETAGCSWVGTKCYCRSDGSSAGNMRVTVGLTCNEAGFVTDYRIYSFEISNTPKYCQDIRPPECDRALYIYSDDHSQESVPARILGNIVDGVRSAVTSVVSNVAQVLSNVVDSVRSAVTSVASSIRRVWSSWF